MANEKPLILKDGKTQQMQAGVDTIDPVFVAGASGPENFSYHKIIAGKTVKVEAEQHMITTSVEIDGFLDLEGGLVFL